MAATAPVRSDAEIARTFRIKLAKSKLAADGIDIQVQNGTATLTGRTSVLQHKGTATRMAKSAGARTVHNRIAVSEAAKQKALARLDAGRSKKSASPSPGPSAAPAQQAPPPVRRAQIRH